MWIINSNCVWDEYSNCKFIVSSLTVLLIISMEVLKKKTLFNVECFLSGIVGQKVTLIDKVRIWSVESVNHFLHF